MFHNTKRQTIGLVETKRREWLLPIQYRKRETFAYACEAYSRILEIDPGTVLGVASKRAAGSPGTPVKSEVSDSGVSGPS